MLLPWLPDQKATARLCCRLLLLGLYLFIPSFPSSSLSSFLSRHPLLILPFFHFSSLFSPPFSLHPSSLSSSHSSLSSIFFPPPLPAHLHPLPLLSLVLPPSPHFYQAPQSCLCSYMINFTKIRLIISSPTVGISSALVILTPLHLMVVFSTDTSPCRTLLPSGMLNDSCLWHKQQMLGEQWLVLLGRAAVL